MISDFLSIGETYIINNRVWIPSFTIILKYSVEMKRKSVLSNLSFRSRIQTFNACQHDFCCWQFPVCWHELHDLQNVFLIVLSRLLFFSNPTSDSEYSKLDTIRKIHFIIYYVFLAWVTILLKMKWCQETVIRLPSSMHVTYEVNLDFAISFASTYSKSWMIPNPMTFFKNCESFVRSKWLHWWCIDGTDFVSWGSDSQDVRSWSVPHMTCLLDADTERIQELSHHDKSHRTSIHKFFF